VTTPFYVSPEQIMKDKADYARKGIARGRSVVVLTYADGILFVAENPSRALHKISEIYDRIAFAAVGKYNEFEALRVAGVRLADMRGYSYDRRDVTGRGLANAYAQTLGAIFTEAGKPYEVEIVVAEVGETPELDQMYRLTYDGSVGDERDFVAMGGSAEQVTTSLREHHREGMSLGDALGAAVAALTAHPQDGEDRTLTPSQLEVAVLDRTRPNRLFKRIVGAQLESLIASNGGGGAARKGKSKPTGDDAPSEPSGPEAADPDSG
jgi:proteasome alpha subunit